jgi:hypothetical protein
MKPRINTESALGEFDRLGWNPRDIQTIRVNG